MTVLDILAELHDTETQLVSLREDLLAAEYTLDLIAAQIELSTDQDGNPIINGKNEAQRTAQRTLALAEDAHYQHARSAVTTARRAVRLAEVNAANLRRRLQAADTEALLQHRFPRPPLPRTRHDDGESAEPENP